MSTRSADLVKIREAHKALIARMERELKPADDERSIAQALEAEDTVDRYLAAVQEQSLAHPDRQELAFALAFLLLTSQTMKERDLDLLGRLNAPSIGMSLFAIAAQVEEMKLRAITGYEKLAASADDASADRDVVPPTGDDAVPF
ncbi:hypothetical protein PQR02_38260 [Paraburkholderia sediminicola]|uniref:Uncharacterized protein n=1 Tax=Paraburkholderia rhynchosiae TaxID=487049 RepID=A0ACC7NPN8_9BURK